MAIKHRLWVAIGLTSGGAEGLRREKELFVLVLLPEKILEPNCDYLQDRKVILAENVFPSYVWLNYMNLLFLYASKGWILIISYSSTPKVFRFLEHATEKNPTGRSNWNLNIFFFLRERNKEILLDSVIRPQIAISGWNGEKTYRGVF